MRRTIRFVIAREWPKQKAGVIKYPSFERKVERVLLHGDTAVVMGGETVKHLGGPDDGKTVERRYTDVWAKKDGRWLMLARHASVVSVK
jgi:ketosteroid isomerase-like protein